MHPHAQSPRFHQQQQQQALLQQQQIQQQLQHHQLQQQLREQQQLQELQEQLRMEELERQLRAQHLMELQQQGRMSVNQQRRPSVPTLSEVAAAEQLLRRRQQQRSPGAFLDSLNGSMEAQFQQNNMQYLPQDIQLQQRLVAEAAQAEFLQQLKRSPNPLEQEALRAEAMRKIMEAERMEDKRRRKQAKLAHMVHVSRFSQPVLWTKF
jgi:DNA topoisomerase 2-associated protein PAT1